MVQELLAEKLNLSQLTVLATNLIEYIGKSIPNDELIQKISHLLEKDLKEFEGIFEELRESDDAQILSLKDAERDKAFLAFREFIIASGRRRNVEISKAANTVLQQLRKQGWNLHKLADTEETVRLRHFLQDLRHIDTAIALDKLRAKDWLSELKEAELEFEKEYNRASSNLQMVYPFIKKAKIKFVKHLNTLISMVEELEELDETGKINLVLRDIYGIINTYDTVHE